MSDDYSLTANYGLKKPTIAADVDVWGVHWNENADLMDNLIKTQVDDMAGLFLPLAGGTVTGPAKFQSGVSVWNVATPAARPAVTGSRGGNAALASFLTAMASYGYITDGTTA
jgi:hypothetical protein